MWECRRIYNLQITTYNLAQMKKPQFYVLIYPRAARLHFLPVSMLGVALGVAYAARTHTLNGWRVAGAALLVACAHAAANLINDVGDSRSGADWIARDRHSLHGGSKLIQAGVLSERWYVRAAWLTYAAAAALIAVCAFAAGPEYILPLGLLILLWSHQYSMPPLSLAYRGLGEVTVAALFGPATVCGTYVLLTSSWCDVPALLLGCVSGVWAALVLLCNECADRENDRAAGKRTLAVLIPPRWLALLVALACAAAAGATWATQLERAWLAALLQLLAGGVVTVLIARGTPRATKTASRAILPLFAAVLLALLACVL